MENPEVERSGVGGDKEHESGSIATNLQRSRSIPEPIIDPQDINNSGMLWDILTYVMYKKGGGDIIVNDRLW